MINQPYSPRQVVEKRPLLYQVVQSPQNTIVKPTFVSPTISYSCQDSNIVKIPVIVQKELQLVEDLTKIDSLQSQMKLLIDQNNYFQNQLEITRNKPPLIHEKIHIVEDTSKIESLNNQFTNLLGEMKNINLKKLNKEEENNLLKQQVNQLSTLHKQSELENKQLNSKIKEITFQFQQSKATNEIFQQQNQVSTNRIESLRQVLSQYLDDLKKKNQVLDISNKRISSMEDQLKEMKSLKLNLSIMESSHKIKTNKLSELENIKYVLTLEGVEKEKRINELAFNIENQKDIISDLSNRIQEYQKTINKYEDFIQSQSSIIKQQIIDKNELIEENTINNVKLENKISKMKEVQVELDSLEILLKQKNIKISELENYRNVIVREGIEKEKEIIEQGEKIEELTHSLTSLQQILKQLQQDIQKQESYINTQSNVISTKCQDNLELRNENIQQNNELDTKTRNINQNKGQIEKLENMISQKNKKISELEIQLKIRNTEANKDQDMINSRNSLIQLLKANITTHEQTIIILQENINQYEQHICNQTSMIQSQINENNSMIKEINKKQLSLELAQNKSNDLMVQVEKFEKMIVQKDRLISEQENSKMKLTVENKNYEISIEDQTSQINAQQKSLATLEQTMESLQTSISNSEQLIYNQSNVIKEQILEIQTLCEQRECQTQTLADQEIHIKKLNLRIESLTSQRKEMQLEIIHIKQYEEKLAQIHDEYKNERQQTHFKIKQNECLVNKISKLQQQNSKSTLFSKGSSSNDNLDRISNKEATMKYQRQQITQSSPGRNVIRKNQQVMEKVDEALQNSFLLKQSQIKNYPKQKYIPTQDIK